MPAIWKDFTVELHPIDGEDFFNFDIVKSGYGSIYSGKAWKKPGQTGDTIPIKINDICVDYIDPIVMPPLEHLAVTDTPAYTVFQIFNGVTVASVPFFPDWSYDYDFDIETMGLSFPILDKIDSRQWLFFSIYSTESVKVTITNDDGTVFDFLVGIRLQDDFSNDFNNDFSQKDIPRVLSTLVLDLSRYPGAKHISIDGTTAPYYNHVEYDIINTCNRYALYYINAYGGWDSIVLQGLPTEQDSLTRHIAQRIYDNSIVSNRGRFNWCNEIIKNWTLRTGWLTDSQSARMHHLLNSTQVYLYDMQTAQMLPIVLTGTTTDYKTFKGSGNQMYIYEIQAELAQDRVRR